LFTVSENDCHELLNVNTKVELDKANIAFIEKWFVQQNLELRTLASDDYDKDYLKLLEQLSSSAQETDSQCFDDIYKTVSNNPNYKIYVVEDTNTKKIIANTTVLIERKFIHGGKYVAHIEDVVVDNKYRGRQIGQMLLRYVSSLASVDMNCYKCILDCKSSLVGFYGSCGFTETSVQMSKYY
jgi:glucosamine-phosphate N-acetyltransferase